MILHNFHLKSWLLRLQQNIIWQQDLVEDTFIFLHFHFSETFCVIFIFIWKVDCSGCSRTFIREKQKEIQFCVTHFSKLSRGTGFYTNSFATKGQRRLFDVFTRLHGYYFSITFTVLCFTLGTVSGTVHQGISETHTFYEKGKWNKTLATTTRWQKYFDQTVLACRIIQMSNMKLAFKK